MNVFENIGRDQILGIKYFGSGMMIINASDYRLDI